MATKNILFKISADIGNLEAQLERVAQRIEQLGDTAAKAGNKVKEGLGQGIDDKKYEQYAIAQERARAKAIIQEREKLLQELDKQSQAQAANEKARSDKALAQAQKDADAKLRLKQKEAQDLANILKKEEERAFNDQLKWIQQRQIADEKAAIARAKAEAEKTKAAQREADKAAKIAAKAAEEEKRAAEKAAAAKIKAEEAATKAKERELAKQKAAFEKNLAAEAKAQEKASRDRLAAEQRFAQQRISIGDIVKGGLAVAGINSAIQSLKEFGSEAIRSAAEFQKNQIAFKTFIGSTREANDILNELVQLAIKTPFTSEETINASRVLAAYGFNAAQLLPIVKRLGNIASGTTIPLSQIALVFGQIKAAGKLMGQDLLQLVNAGFNPLQEISERTGESMANLRKRMGEGKISFQEVAESMMYATERGGRFYNLNDKLAETTAGKIEALKESWQVFARETGQALEPTTKAGLELGTSLIDLFKQLAIAAAPAIELFTALLQILNPIIKAITKIIEVSSIMGKMFNMQTALWGEAAVNLTEASSRMQSTVIPKEEEKKQLDGVKATNGELRKRVDILKEAYSTKNGKFTYDVKGVDELNKQLKEGEKIDKTKLTAARNYQVELERAFLTIAKTNEETSKTSMYENIKKRALWAIDFNEQLKKTRPELNRQGVIDREILRLKQLIYDADARMIAAVTEQGNGHQKVKEQVQKIVDLYVELRKLAKEVEDARLTEFRGQDQATKEYVLRKKYAIELQRIEESRAERIKILEKEKLSELQSTNKDAVLSEENKKEIILIVDGELKSRRRLAEIKYNNDLLDIQDKFNEINIKAMEEMANREIAIEGRKIDHILKLNEEAIQRGEKAMEEAKTRRQYNFLKDATEQLLRQREFYINQKKEADLAANRQKEEQDLQEAARKGLAAPIYSPAVFGMQPQYLGASPTVKNIEQKAADDRVNIEQDAKDKIIEMWGSWDNFLAEQHKIRRDAIIDGWSKVISEIQNVSQTVTDEIIRQTDVLISEQQKRVDKAKDIADKGNAEFLQREEERLTKLNEKRARAARTANAIAKSEAVAQAALAVAKAAGETGAGAPFAIASTLIALAAGLATAYSSISSNNFDKGGYTGDGGKYEPAGTVHKGEFVFTKEKTTKYRKLFEEIHAGRTPGLVEGYGEKVIVINNNMNDRLERIERAILSQNRMQVSIDEKGIHGIVSRIDYNNKRINSRF